MIDHIICFNPKGGLYIWNLQLPYRLVVGDRLDIELLYNRGKLKWDKELDDKFYELEFDDYLIVETVEIDHNADIMVFLNMPKK